MILDSLVGVLKVLGKLPLCHDDVIWWTSYLEAYWHWVPAVLLSGTEVSFRTSLTGSAAPAARVAGIAQRPERKTKEEAWNSRNPWLLQLLPYSWNWTASFILASGYTELTELCKVLKESHVFVTSPLLCHIFFAWNGTWDLIDQKPFPSGAGWSAGLPLHRQALWSPLGHWTWSHQFGAASWLEKLLPSGSQWIDCSSKIAMYTGPDKRDSAGNRW